MLKKTLLALFLLVFSTALIYGEEFKEGEKIAPSTKVQVSSLSDDLNGPIIAYEKGLMMPDSKWSLKTDFKVLDFLVLDDLNGDGLKDLLLVLDGYESDDNLVIVDTAQNKVLASASIQRAGLGGQELIFKIAYHNDKIYLIADYEIRVYDLKLNLLKSFKSTDNLWNFGFLNDGLFLLGANGHLYFLNEELDLEKSLYLVPKVNVSGDYYYERYAQMALYDFYLKDDVLYILLENDTIALIDTLSKEVISTKELGIDPEFLQSYINDENILMYAQNNLRSALFFSYRFLENDEDLYILHNMGDSHITSSSNTDKEASIHKFDPDTLEVTASYRFKSDLVYSEPLFTKYDTKDVVVIASQSENKTLKLSILEADNLELISQVSLTLNSDAKNAKIELLEYEDGYLLNVIDDAVYLLNKDYKLVEALGEYYEAEFIARLDNKVYYTLKNKLLVYDAKQKASETLLELDDDYDKKDPFITINYDKKHDHLLALLRPQKGKRTDVLIYDLKNEGTLYLGRVVLSSYDSKVEYLNGTSIAYYLGNENRLLVDDLVINTKTMRPSFSRGFYLDEKGTSFALGDINGDVIEDYVHISDKKATLYLSYLNYGYPDYYKSAYTYELEEDLKNMDNAQIVADIDGDNISEIIINAYNDDGKQVYRLLNGKDLSVRFDLLKDGVYDWGEGFAFTDRDYNDDGYNDIIYIDYDLSSYQLLSGKDGSALLNYEYMSYKRQSDMAPKLDYIAKIKLLDDPQNLVISSNHYIYPYYEYPLGGLSFKDPKSNKTTYISMAFKDDATKLSPIDQNYLMALSNDTTYIIDLEDKSLSLGIDGRYEKAYRLFEELLLIDEESHMRFLSLKRPFTLKEVPEVISHKDLTLDFEKGDGEISISANDVLLEKSTSDQITIELAQGYHQLDLSYEDKDGRLAFGSVEISVIKPTTINIISYVIIILFSLLFITFITFNLLKRRRSS